MEAEEPLQDVIQRIYSQNVVKDISVRPLDSGGSHFSSDVSEVTVDVEDGEGKAKQIHLVMKSLPSLEKQIQHSSKLGTEKELGFYTIAIPAYKKLQENRGLNPENMFPEVLYASKYSILLDDLRVTGFYGSTLSLDENHTVLVLRSLAKFHATGVALKLTDGEFFRAKLLQVVVPALQNANHDRREELNEKFRQEIFSRLTSMKDCKEFAEPVVDLLHNIDAQKLPQAREPFATVLHNDLWRGNVLFKYSSDKKPVEVKFIDFQTTIYNSPARELAYFLCTSVDQDVFDKFDQLIGFYHEVFVGYLKKIRLRS